jgi:hypothetical protein
MRKIVIITAVVCLIAGACVWFILHARRALKVPLTTVQTFSDSLAKADFDGAYAFTAPELRASTSRESFDAVEQHLISEFGKPIRFEAGNIEMEANQYGTHETAEGHWVFQKGQPVFKFDLKYENGRWLIFSFQQR